MTLRPDFLFLEEKELNNVCSQLFSHVCPSLTFLFYGKTCIVYSSIYHSHCYFPLFRSILLQMQKKKKMSRHKNQRNEDTATKREGAVTTTKKKKKKSLSWRVWRTMRQRVRACRTIYQEEGSHRRGIRWKKNNFSIFSGDKDRHIMVFFSRVKRKRTPASGGTRIRGRIISNRIPFDAFPDALEKTPSNSSSSSISFSFDFFNVLPLDLTLVSSSFRLLFSGERIASSSVLFISLLLLVSVNGYSSSFSSPSVSCVTRQLRLAFPLDSWRMLLFFMYFPVDSFNGNRTSRRRQSSTLFCYISLSLFSLRYWSQMKGSKRKDKVWDREQKYHSHQSHTMSFTDIILWCTSLLLLFSLSSCVMFHSLLFPVVWSGLLVTLYFVTHKTFLFGDCRHFVICVILSLARFSHSFLP